MKWSFDFQKFPPPKISAESLSMEYQKRLFLRRTTLLLAASHLIHLGLAMFAILLAPESMTLAMICLILLGISLCASGILVYLFSKKIRTQLIWPWSPKDWVLENQHTKG